MKQNRYIKTRNEYVVQDQIVAPLLAQNKRPSLYDYMPKFKSSDDEFEWIRSGAAKKAEEEWTKRGN